MNKVRQQRIISLQSNKENQYINTNPNIHANANNNINTNFPTLRTTNKQYIKNQYHLNLKLNHKKKTYLNLYTKKQFSHNFNHNNNQSNNQNINQNVNQNNSQHNNQNHYNKQKKAVTFRDCYESKKCIETTRLNSNNDNTLCTQMSGIYLSSRSHERNNYKSTGRDSEVQKYQALQRHEISIKMRAKMIDWMLQIVQAYKCKDETLFLAIFLMDKYLKGCQQRLKVSQLHQIGVTCIYMACKYQQIHSISMKTVIRDISHNKIKPSEVISRQHAILQVLDYRFQRQCLYLITQQMLSELQIQNQNVIHEDSFAMLKSYLLYFIKLISFDFDLLCMHSMRILATAAVLAAIRSLPQHLKSIDLYDSFIGTYAKDYQSSNQICSQIIFLNLNFKSEFGQLQNIHNLNPSRVQKLKNQS